MNRNLIILALCAAALLTGVFAFGQQQKRATQSTRGAAEIPEHIFYEQVFRLLVTLKNTDDYRKQAEFNDEQATALEEYARACLREVAAQDAKSQVIINDYRARAARLKPGDPLPPPPPALKALQEERNAIILRHRDKLQKALGEEKFIKFNQAAHSIVRIEVAAVP